MPSLRVRIYRGDSMSQAMVRSQAKESISSSSKEFDELFAMRKPDFAAFIDTYILSCKEWETAEPLISKSDWKRLIDQLLGRNQ